MAAGIPDRSVVVMRDLIDTQAEARGDAVCAIFDDGSRLTYGQARFEMWSHANGLAEAGVRQDDRVLVMLPNGVDWYRAWWAVTGIGAVLVDVNPAYKGNLLAHAVQLTQPGLAIVDGASEQRLREIAPDLRCVRVPELPDDPGEAPPLRRRIEPWDTHSLTFTSGTTGRSKAVVRPYLLGYMHGRNQWIRSGPDDIALSDLPMFHVTGTVLAQAMWSVGGCTAVREKFSASQYLDVVRAVGATSSTLVGSMPAYLWAMPEREDDADNPLRWVASIPMPPDADGFKRRFGLTEIVSAFGMTEMASPISTPPGVDVPPTSCGRPRPDMQVRVVDEHDLPVPVGEPGELIVRPDVPWTVTPGYVGDVRATARAWRNGWFHTDDLVRCDDDGNYYFVDRKKDAIRRRGENISSFEVEREACTHPAVSDAACVGVPSGYGDDEAKLFYTLEPDHELTPRQLWAHLDERLPAFMVPRYLEAITELPRTPTMKVQKVELRELTGGPAERDRLVESTPPDASPLGGLA